MAMLRRLIPILLLLATPLSAKAELIYDGTLLDAADAYPAHVFLDGTHYLFWCAPSSAIGGGPDAIWYSTKSSSLSAGGWAAPTEIFNRLDSPWAEHHVCDPSVLHGDFSYSSNSYSWALYYSADDNSLPVGVNNAIGVAFADSLGTWAAHPARIIEADGPIPPGSPYGVGQSGAIFGPATDQVSQLYWDTSTGGLGRVRLKNSADAVDFVPTPSLDAGLNELGRDGQAAEPDVAFNPLDGGYYSIFRSLVLRPRVSLDI